MTVRGFGVYREPGPAALRRTRHAQAKKVGQVEAETPKAALARYVFDTYLATPHGQYAGHRYEWRGDRTTSPTWKPDDGADRRGRDWHVVVSLANGANRHEAAFYAVRA